MARRAPATLPALSAASQSANAPGHDLPPGFGNIYVFAVFNALSYQPVLGSPMVLFAKSLGASATTTVDG